MMRALGVRRECAIRPAGAHTHAHTRAQNWFHMHVWWARPMTVIGSMRIVFDIIPADVF